jgi:hypothetical protein
MSKQTVSADGGAMPAQGLPTRRAALSALAGIPALAILPAAARAAPTAVDPIFAAIKRHKIAEAAYVATLNPIDEVQAREQGREITQDNRDAYVAAGQASEDILAELLTTVPLSAAGARAALEYLIGYDDGYHLAAFAPTLLKSPLLMEGENV